MESAGQITLLFHFIGLGLFVAIQVASFVITSQYKKAPDLQTKLTLLKVMRPIGLLSPIAIVVMIITGIGNMHAFQITLSDFSWLRTKLIVFGIAAVLGIVVGVLSRKRGALVGMMVQGKAPADADAALKKYDRLIGALSLIMPLLLLCIIYLSIYGRLGGQE
ncbi:MAG: hypothetical protein EPO24_06615 [Bacteroidetes bacterium]|nr:MAG: hypothetical protein EPO24_06615 [Bacteroidota bacterium]